VRMLRIGALALALLAVVFVASLWRSQATLATFVWDYDFSVDPACSATLTTDCVKEFRILQGPTVVLTVPAPDGAATPMTGLTANATLGRPYGSRTFTAIAVSEAGLESVPSNSIQVLVHPNPPKNFRSGP
jgi:hypothetical protein